MFPRYRIYIRNVSINTLHKGDDDYDDDDDDDDNNNNNNNNRAMKCTYLRFCEAAYFETKVVVFFIIIVKFCT